jgi:hypothetical protein
MGLGIAANKWHEKLAAASFLRRASKRQNQSYDGD